MGLDEFGKLLRRFILFRNFNIDITIDILAGYTIPAVVAAVQEKVKAEVEGSTKYHIHSINITVKKVLPQ